MVFEGEVVGNVLQEMTDARAAGSVGKKNVADPLVRAAFDTGPFLNEILEGWVEENLASCLELLSENRCKSHTFLID